MLSPLFELILPFFLSFTVVILITVLAERYGTKVGGIAGTLPSTIVIAFLFIALDDGVSYATHSVSIAIAIMGLNLLFLAAFATLCTRSLLIALVGAFTVWTLGTIIIYVTDVATMTIPLLAFILCFIIALMYLERYRRVASQPNITMRYTAKKLLLRGLLAGIVIASAVSLSNINVALSGILAMFPAIFLSTMLIAYLEHGPTFTRGLAKGMIYGSPSVAAYGAAIYFLYPTLGILVGTIIAVLLSLTTSLLLYLSRSVLN